MITIKSSGNLVLCRDSGVGQEISKRERKITGPVDSESQFIDPLPSLPRFYSLMAP